jgi:hypothetical protein
MTEQSPSGGVAGFFGLILLVIGALWMTASGLCSAGLLAQMFIDGASGGEMLSSGMMIAMFGGISGAFGFALYAVGRIMRPKS